jgi:hypothetical protein
MTRKRHPSARTTPRLRREIQQRRAEPSREIAFFLGLNPKTVDKWKRRRTTADAPMGPKHPLSTVLNAAEEALIVVFRKHTRLALDDCWKRLTPMIPKLSRSALHRCLKRYGVSRIPGGRGEKLYEVEHWKDSGFVTLRAVALPEGGGEVYLLSAISDLTRFVYAKVVDQLSAYEAAEFLEELIARAPFRLRLVETNNHEAFSDTQEKPWDPKYPERKHPFRWACLVNKISLRVTASGDPAPTPVAKGWADVLPDKKPGHAAPEVRN